MWFGNLVTLAWWDDTWLNEAFASWMGQKTLVQLKPEWDAGWSAGRSRKQALDIDRLASARRVRNPVVEKGDIWGAFDSITYNKGAAVLSALQTSLTPPRLHDRVPALLQRPCH